MMKKLKLTLNLMASAYSVLLVLSYKYILYYIINYHQYYLWMKLFGNLSSQYIEPFKDLVNALVEKYNFIFVQTGVSQQSPLHPQYSHHMFLILFWSLPLSVPYRLPIDFFNCCIFFLFQNMHRELLTISFYISIISHI